MGEQVEKTPEEKKPEVEEKKEKEAVKKLEEKAAEEPKDAPPPPPPPPQEIILKVYMHCEGCARKVRRCLRGFDGVEDIQTDCKTHKVVVKGEKADPMKVLERIQKKSHRQVELLSPIPKPPADEPKVEEKEPPKPEEEKKEEPPQVITVVLKVNMHCEACAQVIRKRILRMKEVENVEPDLKNSQVTVKGTFEAAKLVDYIHKRTGKQAIIVKQDPEPKKEEERGKEEKKEGGEEKKEGVEEKKDGGDEKKSAGENVGDGKEKEKDKEKDKEEKKSEGGEAEGGGPAGGGEDMKVVELRKNEYNYYPYYHHHHPANYQIYPARYGTAEMAYGYPPAPQMFSDENPNACSVM